MQLFVRISIEPEFEKSLYEEEPANIQGRESQHHDSNDLQMTTPPPPQRKCPGGIIGLGDKLHENGPPDKTTFMGDLNVWIKGDISLSLTSLS